eukprot:CAMPEP_0205827506 /NCGR_PEP_ID=MMETSP0206-20130828/32282_1 /ASSEMBLY_ACC=CAM_ASM_000279 /TAXON_ID=36767 /ORGANISM="Euplotes focardii, Strain TN1" /LENGTH=112 /DNA_ID=CAMNT_0053128491 /DNA_START=162 /DNA_END=497 /DNA_ORIENTATION=-
MENSLSKVTPKNLEVKKLEEVKKTQSYQKSFTNKPLKSMKVEKFNGKSANIFQAGVDDKEKHKSLGVSKKPDNNGTISQLLNEIDVGREQDHNPNLTKDSKLKKDEMKLGPE